MDSQSAINSETQRTKGFRSILAQRAGIIRWASVGLILLAVLILMRILPTERALESLQYWVDGLGLWGPLILGILYTLAVLLLMPGSVLTLATAAIYGLLWGTVIVSLASTTAAALAFLIARYLAREKVRRRVEQSPKLTAVDQAIGEQGWKIVALLRLSPAVPFNLQNYLYGVTSICFWPCILTSWLAMLPGTFLYVYVGSLGKTAAAGRETSFAEWAMRGIGLLATLAVTIYVARLARKAIQERTEIEPSDAEKSEPSENHPLSDERHTRPNLGTLTLAVVAVTMLGLSVWATVQEEKVKQFVERLLGTPPGVTTKETDEKKPAGPTFDHRAFNALHAGTSLGIKISRPVCSQTPKVTRIRANAEEPIALESD